MSAHPGSYGGGPVPTRATGLGTVGNVLWILFGGGLGLAVGYGLAGLVLAITIVGIPFAVATWRIALYALLPFDKRVVARRDGLGTGCLGVLFNLLWLVLFGWALALTHLVFAALCAVTIIGLPFALAHLKLALLALWPFGKEIA